MKKALLVVSVISIAVTGGTSQAKINKSPKKMGQMLLASNTAAASSARAVIVPSRTLYADVGIKKPVSKTVGSTTTREAKQLITPIPTPVPAPLGLPTNTVTTTVKVPEKKFEPGLRFKWLSTSFMDLKTIQNFQKNEKDSLDPEATAWEQPSLSYQFTKTSSFGVVPQFFHTWFGVLDRAQNPSIKSGDLKQSGAFYMGDIGLILKQKELGKINDTLISGTLRYDLPTSEITQAANSPGSAWGMLDISKSIAKWDLSVNAWSRFYFQNYLTSTLQDKKSKNLQNPMFRDFFFLNAGYNFSKKFSSTLAVGVIDTISYGDEAGRPIKYANDRCTDLSMTYAFTPSFSVSLGLWEQLPMRAQTRDFNIPFDTTNDAGGGQAYFSTSISI